MYLVLRKDKELLKQYELVDKAKSKDKVPQVDTDNF